MRYQPAIDGLRAIAVILVLLFHAKLSLFSGGYIGVDVFFVISGYLITSLICQEYANGNFTLAGFYDRRVRRILPAFYLVTLSTLAIGAFVLLPRDLAELGKSAVAATAFISNFFFWYRGESYLLGDTDLMPLLHTWSLSIEEQFYLVFPVCVLVACHFFKRRIGFIFLALAIVSLALSVYLTYGHPGAAYYFSPGRAWELLLGAYVAVGVKRPLSASWLTPILQGVGLFMILMAALTYDSHTPFPGLAALVPCLGTAFIIARADQNTLVTRTLSHSILVWCGLISYSLYLWHWPLLVLTKTTLMRELRGHEIALLYLVAIGLAAATWRYVENPFRKRRILAARKRVFALAAGTGCIVIAIGMSLHATDGLLGTPPPEIARIMAAADDYAPKLTQCHNWDRDKKEIPSDCILGDKSQPNFDFVLWGDSHAGAAALAVNGAASSEKRKGLQMTADNCPPLLRTQVIVERKTLPCEEQNNIVYELIRRHDIRHAILIGQWFQYTVEDEAKIALRPGTGFDTNIRKISVFETSIKETIEQLKNDGIDVTVVGPVPYIGWNVPEVLAHRAWHHAPAPSGPKFSKFVEDQASVLSLLKELEQDDIGVIYPHKTLCSSTCLLELNGDILYSDNEHLSTRGADLLNPQLARVISRR